MRASLAKLLETLSVEQRVLTRRRHWAGNCYALHTKGVKSELCSLSLTNKYVSNWTHKVRTKWLIFQREEYYQQSPQPDVQSDFFFRKNLFGRIDCVHIDGDVEVRISSACHDTLGPAVFHQLRKLDCRQSHIVTVSGEVVGFIFLPDCDLYGDTEEFPFCLLADKADIQQLLPLIVSFCESQDYGRHRTSGGSAI